MENTIKETTELLLQGNLTKGEADKILLGLFSVTKRYSNSKEQKLTDGYVRLFGAESASDLDEIIPENELNDRALQIYSEHTDEDAYYNYLKFLWVEYPNGNELQLMEAIPLV